MLEFLINHSPVFYLAQTIWRDEAFSILFAQRSVMSFFSVTFEPPLYYLMLHFWMKLFGQSEIATRSLSILGFALATVVVIHWAEKLFPKHWLSWFLPVFFFFNPMLIYYAFEIRAYAWYILFSVLSLYAYTEKKWKLYVTSTILGLYTHTYMIIVPGTLFLHYLVTQKFAIFKKIKSFIDDPMMRATGLIFLLFSPWLIHVILDFGKLKSSWYFPVDIQLVRSALGNMFIGYEGTPWFLWSFTGFLSILILAATIVAVTRREVRVRSLPFIFMTYIPLLVIIGISFIKPLYVNRYVIPVTVAEVFLVTFAIEAITDKTLQILIAGTCLLSVLGFNSWYPTQHAKLDSRSAILQINQLMEKNDVLLADNPLIFFEAIYYSRDRSRVFYYDPAGTPFPWYVGGNIVSQNQIVRDLPPYPIRAFIIHADATYNISYTINRP